MALELEKYALEFGTFGQARVERNELRAQVERLKQDCEAAHAQAEAYENKWKSICQSAREDGTCACSYDSIDDVCNNHSPKLKTAIAERDAAIAAGIAFRQQRDNLAAAIEDVAYYVLHVDGSRISAGTAQAVERAKKLLDFSA